MSDEQFEVHDARDIIARPHRRAEIVYGIASFAFAIFLLSQIGNELVWKAGTPFTKQPGFWPVIAISGMVIFGAFEIVSTIRRNRRLEGEPIAGELLRWLKAVEYLIWFMAYVIAVPQAGYLPATIVFAAALAWRAGYRNAKGVLAAVGVGILTVVIFKSILQVKIPGGAVYELLPRGIRGFMIQYF